MDRCSRFRAFLVGACVLVAPACGGTVSVSGADASGGDDASRDALHTDAPPPDSARVPLYHRTDDSACTGASPAGSCAGGGTPPPGGCKADTDCTGGTNGRCVENMGGPFGCFCSYDSCQHDTDCKAGEVCACHGSAWVSGGSRCTTAGCRVDRDCGASGFCSPSRAGGCGGVTGYYCHTGADTCVDDGDCPSSAGAQICGWSSTKLHWECTPQLFCP